MGSGARLATLVALGLVSATSCGSDEDEKHPFGDSRYGKVGSALAPSDGDIPFLEFDENAPDGSIALTFDDGPDGNGTTASVLDTLKAKGVAATFFVNANNAIDVEASSTATSLVQRMLAEGHDVGNHGYHHYDLGSTSTNVPAELRGVDDMLHNIAPGALAVRLFRAPYGNPYFGPQSRLDYVAPLVAGYGVHIGWSIDSLDYNCSSATCVRNNVLNAVDSGKSGIVLLHSINQYTAAALGSLIDGIKSRGKRFTKVESLVIAKYGKPSRRLFFCDADSDCVSGERCGSDGHCGGATSDAGTDTSTTDATTDTAVSDGGGSAVVSCSALTVTNGTVTGSSTACTGTSPLLAANDSGFATWNTRADAYATYRSPFAGAEVSAMALTVAFRGDDHTEPLWYWWIHDPAIPLPNGWTLLGDNSWAGNWVTTLHTFPVPTPSRWVDASGNVLVRFGTSASSNIAELNQMVLTITGSTASDTGVSDSTIGDSTAADSAATDSTAVDSTVADSTVTDSTSADSSATDSIAIDSTSADSTAADSTSADSATDATTSATVRCSKLTLVSGALYGSPKGACSGKVPALLTSNGTFVGWAARSGTPKTAAYATYTAPAAVTSMKLRVAYRGDNNTAPLWYWYARNPTTGGWELVGDNSWAASWATTPHTFTIASPARYVSSDGKVQILFTTTSSTNSAELDQMVLDVTY